LLAWRGMPRSDVKRARRYAPPRHPVPQGSVITVEPPVASCQASTGDSTRSEDPCAEEARVGNPRLPSSPLITSARTMQRAYPQPLCRAVGYPVVLPTGPVVYPTGAIGGVCRGAPTGKRQSSTKDLASTAHETSSSRPAHGLKVRAQMSRGESRMALASV
jgi:hypothetical protein